MAFIDVKTITEETKRSCIGCLMDNRIWPKENKGENE